MDELEKIKREKLKKLMEKSSNKIQIQIKVNDRKFQENVIEQSKKIPVLAKANVEDEEYQLNDMEL